MNYTCHSGGCRGADMEWENEGNKYGIKTIAYSFYNHKHDGGNPKILTVEELNEGYVAARKADKILKRGFDTIQYPYVKNLIGRNWFQIKNSEAIFAIGKFSGKSKKIVDGGTGWAIQMAVDSNKPIHFYYQEETQWYKYVYEFGAFLKSYEVPVLTQNFAGIGTREINKDGKSAIKRVYEYNLGNREKISS